MTQNESKLEHAAPSRERIDAIRVALRAVHDPEIPPLSIIDLGIISDVRIENDRAVIDVMPTFAGCPALDVIKASIKEATEAIGEVDPRVTIVFDPPWTTDRITPEGIRTLEAFGLAPPGPRGAGGADLFVQLSVVKCPYCQSMNTSMESIFGPTLCRSMHYCNACLQSFEHFKPV